MQADWDFEHSAEQRGVVEEYWAKQQPRLDRLLTRDSENQPKLHLTLRRRMMGAPWMLRAVLQLRERTLVAEAFGFTPQEAIDRNLEELVRQLKLCEQPRDEDGPTRRGDGIRRRFDDVAPYLDLDVSENRPEAFFRLLMPLLGSLREYARHELNILELEGAIPVNELTPEDLVDEVVVTAWERFKLRPPAALLDVWLTCLLQQRLDQVCSQVKPITLLTPAAFAAKLNRWRPEPGDAIRDPAHRPGGIERLSVEELLPDHKSGDAWSRLSDDERRQRLMAALSLLSKRQRQALMLHAVSNFELSEIAAVLNVSESQIEQWLDDARKILLARLEASKEG